MASGARAMVRPATRLAASLLRSAAFVVQTIGLDIVFVALQVWLELENRRHEEALRRAIDNAVRSQLAGRLRQLITSRGEEVASYFLAGWGRPSSLFLYLSPLLDVTQLPSDQREKYRFDVQFNDDGPVGTRWVSRAPLEVSFEELGTQINRYVARLRWSIEFPLFTPFDAYLAYLDLVGALFSRSWSMAAATRALPPARHLQLAELAQHMSTIAGLLRSEHYAGFTRTEPFRAEQAIADRRALIMRIGALVRQQAEPLAVRLERLGALDQDALVVQLGSDPSIIHGRLRQIAEQDGAISRQLLRLAADLESIPHSALGYRRREGVNVLDVFFDEQRFKANFFRVLTADVQEHIPRELRAPLDFDRPAGEVQLQTGEEGVAPLRVRSDSP